MKYSVLLLETAENDLYEIHYHLEMHDSAERADTLLDGIEQVIAGLTEMPERGHFPPELERIGMREYREVHFKPYRIVYAIAGTEVRIHCVLDGRRDMVTLLQHRLLR